MAAHDDVVRFRVFGLLAWLTLSGCASLFGIDDPIPDGDASSPEVSVNDSPTNTDSPTTDGQPTQDGVPSSDSPVGNDVANDNIFVGDIELDAPIDAGLDVDACFDADSRWRPSTVRCRSSIAHRLDTIPSRRS